MNHATRAHDRFSPSGADRWLKCPGSVLLCEKLGLTGDEGNAASELGTAAHELREVALKSGKSPEAFRGKKFNGLTADDTIITPVDQACDYIRGVAGKSKIFTEREVHIPDMAGKGHLDAACWVGNILHIFDYKNGRHVVRAKNNAQMSLYALGMIAEAVSSKLMTAHQFAFGFPVRLHIVQPNANPDIADTWDTSATALIRWGGMIVAPVAAVILDGTAKVDASDPEACRWCPARGQCKAFAKANAERAGADWADVIAGVVLPPDADTLTPKQIAELVGTLPAFEQWATGIRAEAMRLASIGKLPGHKIVAGKGRRQWAHGAEAALRKLLGAKAFSEPALLGIGAIEKLLPAKVREPTMDKWTAKKPGGPTLAPKDDPRPSFSGDARVDFATDIEE